MNWHRKFSCDTGHAFFCVFLKETKKDIGINLTVKLILKTAVPSTFDPNRLDTD